MRKLSKNNVLFSNREKFRQIVWRLLTQPFLLRFWFNFFCSFDIFDLNCFLMKLSWFHCIEGHYRKKNDITFLRLILEKLLKFEKNSWNRFEDAFWMFYAEQWFTVKTRFFREINCFTFIVINHTTSWFHEIFFKWE